jgi:RNA polymerase sigma-70 factor, ECF subfamily
VRMWWHMIAAMCSSRIAEAPVQLATHAIRAAGDADLLGAITLLRDHRAGDELFRRYHDDCFQVALRMLTHACDAEDAVQNAFMQLFQVVDTRSCQNVRAYLLGIVVNVCRMHLRAEVRRQMRQQRAAEIGSGGYQIQPTAEDDLAMLREAIDQLPTRYRLPVELRYSESMSCKDIATRLGANVKTIESQIKRGLDMARQWLQRSGHPTMPALS